MMTVVIVVVVVVVVVMGAADSVVWASIVSVTAETEVAEVAYETTSTKMT